MLLDLICRTKTRQSHLLSAAELQAVLSRTARRQSTLHGNLRLGRLSKPKSLSFEKERGHNRNGIRDHNPSGPKFADPVLNLSGVTLDNNELRLLS